AGQQVVEGGFDARAVSVRPGDGELVAPDVEGSPRERPLRGAQHFVPCPQQGDDGRVRGNDDLVYGLLAPGQSAARGARRGEPVCLVCHVGWEPATLRSWNRGPLGRRARHSWYRRGPVAHLTARRRTATTAGDPTSLVHLCRR